MSAASEQIEESIWSILLLLIRKWKILAACMVASWTIGGLLFLLSPRTYVSEALLAPASDDASATKLGGMASQLGGLASLAGISLPAQDSDVDIALALLRSRGFTEAFISENQLLSDLFSDRWNALERKWKGSGDQEPTLHDAFQKFSRSVLDVTRDRQTGLVTLSISWTDRDKAAHWADQLVKKINDEMRMAAQEESRRSLDFLNQELQSASSIELRQSIYGLIEAQVNRAMLASVKEDYVFRVIDPPHVADADKYISPNPVLIAALSTALGAFLGAAVVLAYSVFMVESGRVSR